MFKHTINGKERVFKTYEELEEDIASVEADFFKSSEIRKKEKINRKKVNLKDAFDSGETSRIIEAIYELKVE